MLPGTGSTASPSPTAPISSPGMARTPYSPVGEMASANRWLSDRGKMPPVDQLTLSVPYSVGTRGWLRTDWPRLPPTIPWALAQTGSELLMAT